MSTLTPKAKKMSKAALTDSGTTKTIIKDCTITNNATIDVLVLDAYSDDDSQTEEVFDQTLKVLAPEDSSSSIKASSTGKVLLDEKYLNDNSEEVDRTGYELIIVKADCLYPVKATHSSRQHNTTTDIYSYPGVTISNDADKVTGVDDYANMQSAEKFVQNIMAYPSYTLAQNYQTACDNEANAPSDNETPYIDNFFAGTVNYKKVDINMVVAVTTYYNQFPYVWADYQGSKTYYLYNSDGSTVSYVGSLLVKVATDVPAKADKTLPGFTFTFTSAPDKDGNTTDTNMFFQKGKFVDTITDDIPGISLYGSFSLKSDLTKVATDTKLISVMVGRVGSAKVIGLDEKQEETEVKDPSSGDTSKKWSGTYDLLHADSIGKVINLLMVAGGLFMTFKELYGGCKKLNEWRLKRKAAKEEKGDDSPLTEDDLVEIKGDQNAYMDNQLKANQQEMAKTDPSVQVPKPEDMKAMMDEFSKQITERVNADLKITLQEGMNAQMDMYNKILDVHNSKTLDKIKDNMDDNQDKLDSATTPETCASVLPDVTVQSASVNEDIKVDFNVAMKQAACDKGGLSNSKSVAEERVKVSQDMDQSRERAEQETEPEDLDFPFKEYDPSIFE